MAVDRGRYKRNRHILGGPLSEVEVQTLQEMSRHRRHADFRRRALGVLALNEGRSVEDISGVLRVTVPPVYKWARAWKERGLMGMLSGHVGGPPEFDSWRQVVDSKEEKLPLQINHLNEIKHLQRLVSNSGAPPSLHHRQFRHAQRQPLHAVAWKVDLGAGIGTAAFHGQHFAFAKLGVKHGAASRNVGAPPCFGFQRLACGG